MANMFDPPWTPAHRFASGRGVEPPRDEDQALGFECANPSLQCEGWEPVPHAPLETLAPGAV